MNLINNEYIYLKDISGDSVNKGENYENNSIKNYLFRGVNDEVFELAFDENEKYFKIIRNENNDLIYQLKCESSYRTPDLKKLFIALKYSNFVDNENIVQFKDLKIINISTTFECYYDEKLKKDIYTKNPKYYTYLLIYNGFYTILSYNEKKYSTKPINISKNDYDYFN